MNESKRKKYDLNM